LIILFLSDLQVQHLRSLST